MNFSLESCFIEDTQFETETENVDGSIWAILRRYLKSEKKNQVNRNSSKNHKKFVIILLTNNHVNYYDAMPAVLKNESLVIKLNSVEGTFNSLNSYYKKRWLLSAKLLGFRMALKYKSNLKLLKIIERNFVQYCLLYFALKDIAEQIRPQKVILFKAENFQARAISRSCKLVGQKSISIQHGLIPASHSQFRNLLVDEYFVWGKVFVKRLKENMAGCKIQIAGNLKSDLLFKEKENLTTRIKLNKILALPNSGTSHTSIDDVELLIEGLLEAARNIPTKEFFIKPHPADVNNNVEEIMSTKELPSNLKMIGKNKKINFTEFEVLIINNSASGLEAAIFNIPQIVVCRNKKDIMVPQYLEYNTALFANSTKNVNSCLEKILENKPYFQKNCDVLTNDFISYQGKASDRLVQLLEC